MAKLHLAQEILDIIYPVGSIYISTTTTNPSTFFGGTWERIKGRFLLGADDSTYKIGGTGGEASHTLSIDEMPSHNHTAYSFVYNSPDNPFTINPSGTSKLSTATGDIGVDKTGGGKAHNNMPPYLVTYIWKRTA